MQGLTNAAVLRLSSIRKEHSFLSECEPNVIVRVVPDDLWAVDIHSLLQEKTTRSLHCAAEACESRSTSTLVNPARVKLKSLYPSIQIT